MERDAGKEAGRRGDVESFLPQKVTCFMVSFLGRKMSSLTKHP